MADGYIYAVTRIHLYEQSLLTKQDIEQMMAAKDAPGVMQILAEKGWDTTKGAVAMLAKGRDETWALMEDSLGDLAPLDAFRVPSDYHNLKAAIKLTYTNADTETPQGYFLPYGTVDIQDILAAAQRHDFSALPKAMADAGTEAYEALSHTANGQACDMIIDAAALKAIDAAGTQTGSGLIREWAQLTVDIANIKAAVRCAAMGKDADFIARAVPDVGTLDTAMLRGAAAQGPDAIYEYLGATGYADAVDALRQSVSAFELWANNRIVALIRPQRFAYEGVEPLAAYLLARENELAVVRLVLSAKVNGLPQEAIAERLRDMYV